MSPVLIACGMPCMAHSVGRWRRSTSPSSMSSWTRLKLWPSSTAAAPGRARLVLAGDRGVGEEAEERAHALAGRRPGSVEPEVVADHLVDAVGRRIAVADERQDLVLGRRDELGELESRGGGGHRGPSVRPRPATRPRRRRRPPPAAAGRAGRSVLPWPRARPRTFTTDAIVLSRFDLGEADRVLTLITPARRQAQGDRQGRPPADAPARRQRRAVRRAARPAGPRPDLRGRHPGQRRPRLAAPARLARAGGHGLVPRRAGRPLARGAPPGRAALPAPQPGLRAARRRDGPGPGRPLVRDAPDRRARRPARARSLRRVRPDARGQRHVPLGAAARRRPVPARGRAAGRAGRPGLEALKLLKAYQRMDVEGLAQLLRVPGASSARSRRPCATSSGSPSSATRGRCRSSTRSGPSPRTWVGPREGRR